MFELKRLHPDAVSGAVAKAERYRLLNEAREAESICRDVLAVVPDHAEARKTLILALTDQFLHRLGAVWNEARALADALPDAYSRAYFRGILHERRAKTHLKLHRVGALRAAHEDFRTAMEAFHEAEAAAPADDDAALLRWNTCARILNENPSLAAAEADEPEPSMLE
ncbi:MAG TPA: hypothetical protein VFV75_19830 [Candidatus Polarisedimenticolaceae bacterium]|nr:hypothetical protein [Candidatus Polarisedimenticolaceae bacterium]